MKHKMKLYLQPPVSLRKNNRWLLESFIALAEDFKYGVSITFII